MCESSQQSIQSKDIIQQEEIKMFRAIAILVSFIGASAFAPPASSRMAVRSSLKMGYENEVYNNFSNSSCLLNDPNSLFLPFFSS